MYCAKDTCLRKINGRNVDWVKKPLLLLSCYREVEKKEDLNNYGEGSGGETVVLYRKNSSCRHTGGIKTMTIKEKLGGKKLRETRITKSSEKEKTSGAYGHGGRGTVIKGQDLFNQSNEAYGGLAWRRRNAGKTRTPTSGEANFLGKGEVYKMLLRGRKKGGLEVQERRRKIETLEEKFFMRSHVSLGGPEERDLRRGNLNMEGLPRNE